jgi:hypothetical protein
VPHSKGFSRRKDRRSTDPVSIGEVVDGLLAEDLFSRGLPVATLMRQWPELVGERLAEATTPVSLEGGVLVVRAADGPWGSQARYLLEEIRERADRALGGGQVRSVRIAIGPGGGETGNRR